MLSETAGQLAESTLISESSRLRLEQKRRVLQESVESFAETEEAVPAAVVLEENVKKELNRAGAISALALVGSVGSKVISNQKMTQQQVVKNTSISALPEAPPPAPRGMGLHTAESSSSAVTSAGAAGDSASASAATDECECFFGFGSSFDDDDDDLAACLAGGTCAPDWDVVDEDTFYREPAVDSGGVGTAPASGAITENTAAFSSSSSEAATAAAAPLLKRDDWYDVIKTVVFSACYGGFFQPHWFNVLNSYDWSAIVLPPKLEFQLQMIVENLQRGQTMPGVSRDDASFALSRFLEVAGGYGDPSLVADVSLSLVAPLEAAGSFLAPLAVNQLITIPLLYWPSFFLFTGAVEGQSLSTVLPTLHRRLPQVMKANLAFWIPAQGFQFSSVPPEDQAIYVAVMGVLWNGVLAALMLPKPQQKPPPRHGGGAERQLRQQQQRRQPLPSLPPFDVTRVDTKAVKGGVAAVDANDNGVVSKKVKRAQE